MNYMSLLVSQSTQFSQKGLIMRIKICYPKFRCKNGWLSSSLECFLEVGSLFGIWNSCSILRLWFHGITSLVYGKWRCMYVAVLTVPSPSNCPLGRPKCPPLSIFGLWNNRLCRNMVTAGNWVCDRMTRTTERESEHSLSNSIDMDAVGTVSGCEWMGTDARIGSVFEVDFPGLCAGSYACNHNSIYLLQHYGMLNMKS